MVCTRRAGGYEHSGGRIFVTFDEKEAQRCYAVAFDYDEWVYTINDKEKTAMPEGPRMTLPMALLTPDRLTRQSAAATYLPLLDVALRAEGGAGIQDMSLVVLQERTGLTTKLLTRARQELKQWQKEPT